MARSKKHRRHAEKLEAEVDESPFARVTADIVTRGQFSLARPQADDELQKSRFLASTAGMLVYKGEAAPSAIDLSAQGSALADAIGAHRLADEEIHRLRDELAALKVRLAERDAASASETEATSRESSVRALEDMRSQAEAAREEADAQIQTLRDELASIRSTLAERESALAQAALDHEQARAGWQLESQGSLSNTEQTWKAAEAARLAKAEAKWWEDSQRSLADLRAQAEATRDQAEKDAKVLRDNIAALRAILADRESALAQAVSDQDQARARWQQESQAALSNAEQAWKAAEAARFADAKTKWEEHTAQALDKARESAEGTIRGLQDQMSALQASLAERDAALAKAAFEAQRTREQMRQELDAVLAKMKSWQADEAQRLAAAEAKWKQQSAAALAEAQARYQTAEGTLVQLRLDSDRARSNATGGSISPPKSGDRSAFGTKAAAREPEPAAIRLPTREPRGQPKQDQIVLQPHRVLEDPRPRKRRGLGRDMVVVAGLAIAAIVAYPRIEPLIPEPWRSNIAALTGGFGSPSSVAVQGSAVVAREVNLRAGSSTSASIISTLAPGQNVAMLARREEWTFVEVAADSRNPQPRRGWVFSSFLAASTEDDGDTAESEGSE